MSAERRDLIVTWPKTTPLQDYLDELAHAERDDLVINYRVAHLPRLKLEPGNAARCYMVYDGQVRGWCQMLGVAWRGPGEVRRVGDSGFWPEGSYIIRSPTWHPVEPLRMRGFQGWRYFDGSLAKDCL